MCPIIEINLYKRDYRDYLLWCIIWNCWCKRHSRTERRSTKLANSPAGTWTSESAVREKGGEGGRERERGGGGGKEGGGLVGNAHRRRDVGWPRTSVAVMRVRAGVRGQWRRPDGAARAAARAIGGDALMLGAGAPLRGGRSRSPIRCCSGLAGVRAASEQIGGATNQRVWHDALTSRFSIGVKISGPNERIQILCGIQIRSKLPEWLFSAIYQSDCSNWSGTMSPLIQARYSHP